MYIVNTSKYSGKFPIIFKKVMRLQKEPETVQNTVLTEIPQTLTPQTTGAGMSKLTKSLETVKLQNTDTKLKKFISLKL